MKTIIQILALCLLHVGFIYSQEFSFKMYFEDAAGFKDTIELGYDAMATDSVDEAFGEVNIINEPLDTNFYVIITNEWRQQAWGGKATYYLKKQIVGKETGVWNYALYSIVMIDIFSENWPVTAIWDNSLFDDDIRRASVFTSAAPGFDVGSRSDLGIVNLFENDRATFTANHEKEFLNLSYINSNEDTVSIFWVDMMDKLIFGDVDEINTIERDVNLVYNSKLKTATLSEFYNNIKGIRMFGIDGKEIPVKTANNVIYLNRIDAGIYFLHVKMNDGRVIGKKIHVF